MRLFCFCSSFKLVHTKIQQFKNKEIFWTTVLCFVCLLFKYLLSLFWMSPSKLSAIQDQVREDVPFWDFSQHHNPKSLHQPIQNGLLSFKAHSVPGTPLKSVNDTDNNNLGLKEVHGWKHYLRKRKMQSWKACICLERVWVLLYFSQAKITRKSLTQTLYR